MIPCPATEIVTEEQPSDRVQDTARHLQHVLHDLLDGCVRDRHVHGTDSNHEVETGYDVSGIPYGFVEVSEVVLVMDVCII